MLQAEEGDAAAINNELARIRRANPDHEDDVQIAIDREQLAALLLGRACKRHDIGTVQHRAEIAALCQDRRTRDLQEMGAVRIYDVIVPVRCEKLAVGREVSLVGGEAVGAVEDSKKIGQQVDQHATGAREAARQAIWDAE